MKEILLNYGLLFLLVGLGCLNLLRAEDTTEECRFGHWKCLTTGKCVPLSWKCDGDPDCGGDDKSDEEKCPPKTCADKEFNCPSTGQCVPKGWACDGEPDCKNGEDEDSAYCTKTDICPKDEFSCGDGNCVTSRWKCDGVEDCDNGADELNCTVTCGDDMFKCNNGDCIANSWLCDGDNDCLDGSDELKCGEIHCEVGEFKCDDSSRCIDIKWKCDGDFDCSDHSDETNNCTPTIGEPEICSPTTEFKCITSGECIHKSWQCDGDVDCTDNSDEGSACNYTCRSDQFMCKNYVCISATLRCDGNEDCTDGSDEKECVIKKTCDELGEFDCYGDGSLCISMDKVCDGRNDCQRREDEDSALCKHHNPCSQHTCTHDSHCVNKAYPNNTLVAKCECNSGYKWVEDESLCKDIDECEQPGICSQICNNTLGGYKCECYPGYVLQKHFFCRADGEQAWLYYANRRDIRRLRTDSRYMEIIVEETTNSIALDIDYEDGLMFWTDGGTEKIMRAKVGEAVLAEEVQMVISNKKGHAFSPDGLAVDWLYKHFYWTDTGSDTITVANYNGDKSTTLVSTGLDDPRAICVDPQNGYMYWTDWGQNPKIERCGMDGQNRETIVNGGDDLQWPNGLTIDYIGKRIYWIDSKLHKIGTANLDGSEKSHVLVDSNEIRRPFSISVFEDSLYWTDWHTNSIRSVHKVTGRNARTLSLGSYSVMDIKVYHEMRQIRDFKEQAKALCSAAQCEYMCLPAAKKTSGNATVSCACADNQQLKSDKKTCMTGPSTPAPTPKPTDKPTVTQKPVETTQKPAGTTQKPVQTTKAAGYTVVPEESTTVTVGTPGNQEGKGVGGIAAITATIVAVLLIVIFAVGCFIFRRYKSRNKKSMNFDNPVYRKTTTTDDHIVIGKDVEPQMEPLTSNHECV